MMKTMQNCQPSPWKPLINSFQQNCPMHIAQFYAEDRFVLEAAAQFIRAALAHGQAGILVVTAEHRVGIAERLEKQGIDLATGSANGRYIEIDATEMLSRIMPQGHLDPVLFFRFMGDVMVHAKAAVGGNHPNVTVFGEAVSVLCARGEHSTALQLEQLWNELLRKHSFLLLCGYAANTFDHARDTEIFNRICEEHTEVLPEESFLELQDRAQRLRYIAELQQKARSLATETAARQQAEEALARSEKLATVGRLTASIAHEINNPLASLTNLFYLINNDKSLDPAARHYAALADQELQRTARITKQMLAFHRESASPVPCTLASIADGVLELYGPRLRASNITLETQYRVEGAIEGFAAEMRQLFANLIGNAIEAMGGEGRIVLRVSSARDWTDPTRHGVRVSIADTGPGISRADQNRIFEPFFTTKGESGTGLGLWVCHGIVQKHRGRIRFRSRPHQQGQHGGTVFSLFLPATASHEHAVEQDVSGASDSQNALRATG